MFAVLARITVKPEAADTAREILLDLVGQSRKEAGCINYDLYQQAGAPHIFQTVESWKSQADSDAHMASQHVGAAIAAAGSLFAVPPEIVAWTKLA